MESITHLFQSLDFVVDIFSVLIAISGLIAAYRGYKAAGLLMTAGAILHGVGLFLLRHQDLTIEMTPFRSLLISGMYPGTLLFTIGVFCLALALPAKRSGA